LVIDYEIEFMGDELDQDYSGFSTVLSKTNNIEASTVANDYSTTDTTQLTGSNVPVNLLPPNTVAGSTTGPFGVTLPTGCYLLNCYMTTATAVATFCKIRVAGSNTKVVYSPFCGSGAVLSTSTTNNYVGAVVYPATDDATTDLGGSPGISFNTQWTYPNTASRTDLQITSMPSGITSTNSLIGGAHLSMKPKYDREKSILRFLGWDCTPMVGLPYEIGDSKEDDGLTDEQRETLSVSSQVCPDDDTKMIVDAQQFKQLIAAVGKREAKDSDLKSVSSGISFFNSIVGKK